MVYPFAGDIKYPEEIDLVKLYAERMVNEVVPFRLDSTEEPVNQISHSSPIF
jgi:hypothetical protein